MERKMIPICEGLYFWADDVESVDVYENEHAGRKTVKQYVGRKCLVGRRIYKEETEFIPAFEIEITVKGHDPYQICPLSEDKHGDMVWFEFEKREVYRNQLNNKAECFKEAEKIVARINAALNEVAK